MSFPNLSILENDNKKFSLTFPFPFFSLATLYTQLVSIYGRSVYKLITEIEWTNQNARNAIFEVENLIIANITANMGTKTIMVVDINYSSKDK